MTSPHSLPTEREIEMARELQHRISWCDSCENTDKIKGGFGAMCRDCIDQRNVIARSFSLYAKERSDEALDRASEVAKNFTWHETAHTKMEKAGFGKCGLCEISNSILKLKESK